MQASEGVSKDRFEDEVFENANEEDLDRDIKVDAENPISESPPPQPSDAETQAVKMCRKWKKQASRSQRIV